MPSASTNKPMSASLPIMSSLCSRTLPVSVSATLVIFPFKLIVLHSWRSARYSLPAVFQGGGHLSSRVVALFWGLCQRPIDHLFHALGQVRPECPKRGMRRLGDLLHQAGHRICGEGKLAGQQLK